MQSTSPPRAVTFDFGQTLAELDTELLAIRLGERGVRAEPAALEAAVPTAWRRYDDGIRAGMGGHPWKLLMQVLLDTAGATGDLPPAIDWLWTEQPRRNLWRRPIAGVIEIAVELRATGLPVGVVSNSEGKLSELAAELGWSDRFDTIADSGALGIEKPDPAIFEWCAERLGVTAAGIVHVGDSWAADVEGALAAGATAIWFGGAAGAPKPPAEAESRGVAVARDASELRAHLSELGLL